MIAVPLEPVPNQLFTARLGDRRFEIALRDTGSVMAADVAVNGVTILSGHRVVAGTPLIPYQYLEAGNFLLLTADGDLPDWREFGGSQSLVYLEASDGAI